MDKQDKRDFGANITLGDIWSRYGPIFGMECCMMCCKLLIIHFHRCDRFFSVLVPLEGHEQPCQILLTNSLRV
jgi:hypothetical protein